MWTIVCPHLKLGRHLHGRRWGCRAPRGRLGIGWGGLPNSGARAWPPRMPIDFQSHPPARP
eukprot:7894270-Alexandrium_andersonii.AAC.1